MSQSIHGKLKSALIRVKFSSYLKTSFLYLNTWFRFVFVFLWSFLVVTPFQGTNCWFEDRFLNNQTCFWNGNKSAQNLLHKMESFRFGPDNIRFILSKSILMLDLKLSRLTQKHNSIHIGSW